MPLRKGEKGRERDSSPPQRVSAIGDLARNLNGVRPSVRVSARQITFSKRNLFGLTFPEEIATSGRFWDPFSLSL